VENEEISEIHKSFEPYIFKDIAAAAIVKIIVSKRKI